MSDLSFIEKCRSVCAIVRGQRKGHDPNHVPEKHRIDVRKTWGNLTPSQANSVEKRYFESVVERRKARPKFASLTRQVAAIPPELYFGKIRETKDRSYWKDKVNLRNHKETLIRPNDI